MVDQLDGPLMEAWLRSTSGLDGWIVRTTAESIEASNESIRLSAQPSTWDASRAWEGELRKRGLWDWQIIGRLS